MATISTLPRDFFPEYVKFPRYHAIFSQNMRFCPATTRFFPRICGIFTFARVLTPGYDK